MLGIGKIRNIHFIGIGGIGMSGMAELLYRTGYSMSGSDLEQNDRTIFLAKLGLKIFIGHNENNVVGANLVVFSSAVDHQNIEIKKAKELGIPIMRRAEMLAELVRIKPLSIGVSGTHGKTTTCSIIGSILYNAKKDPTIVIGGIVKEFNTNAISGKGDIIVVEADEYDKTFLSLHPVISIINNIEEEHLDCYKDFSDLKNAFQQFANNIPFYGFLLANSDDMAISSIVSNINKPIIKYGLDKKADYSAQNISFSNHESKFDLYHKDKKIDSIELIIPGLHNIYNSLCAISLCLELGVSIGIIKKSLKEFEGVKRRFDIKYNKNGNLYIDDYAHHPTEIKTTIEAAKKGWPNKKIISIFQPHLYSRTKSFFEDFADALLDSDKIMLLEIYGAREQKIEGVSSQLIQRALVEKGHANCEVIKSDELIGRLKHTYKNNQIVITMGAGDLWTKGEDIIKNLYE